MKSNDTRKIRIFLLCIFSILFLSGCPHYTVEQIDYKSPQKAAVIVVGDPQVYARASLINDRRREAEYLQQLLANSAVDKAGNSTVVFSPQIVRDLKTIQALSVNLGISAGQSIDSSTATDAVTKQIEATKLQAQLAVLQKQVEGIKNASAPQITIPSPDLSASNTLSVAQSGASNTVITPDLKDLQSSIKDIQTQLKDLSAAAANGPAAPSNSYEKLKDPRSDFIDRQAYRRDIRAALSEAQLDDVHDRGGNALYRLQFQVTVLPPVDDTRQWGAVKMDIKPPTLQGKDIESLYYEWLGYISRKIDNNFTPTNQNHNYDFDRYIADFGRLNFFNVIDIFIGKKSNSTVFYCLDHRTAEDSQLQDIIRMKLPGGRKKVGTYAVPPDFINPDMDCGVYPVVTTEPIVLTKELNSDKAKAVLTWISQNKAQNTGPNLPKPGTTRKVYRFSDDKKYDRIDYVPQAFCEAIVDKRHHPEFCSKNNFQNDPLKRIPAAGGNSSGSMDKSGDEHPYAVRSYSVLPTELAQRLGVTTESSQSLQTALSVAAQASTTVKAMFNAGYLSQSDARAQALARQPIVVGFAGSEPGATAAMTKTNNEEIGKGFFGWLFGPEFYIKDTKTLALKQGVRSYGVNADISVPGWWNYIIINVSTAWIENWYADRILTPLSETGGRNLSITRKMVNLPISDATFDSLTNYIADQEYGRQNSRIFTSSVTPTMIPACASFVTFQIGGANIWRADSVYLGGAKAKTINVLPDMNGISAEFDMDAVYGTLVNTDSIVQTVPLMVSAEQGSAAPLLIYIVGQRQKDKPCQSPYLMGTNADWVDAEILSYSPKEVCSDATFIPLVINGLQLPSSDVKIHSEHFEDSTDTDWKGNWLHREIDLRLKKGMKLVSGMSLPIALTYEQDNFKGSLAINLTVTDCSSKSKPGDQATPAAKPAADATAAPQTGAAANSDSSGSLSVNLAVKDCSAEAKATVKNCPAEAKPAVKDKKPNQAPAKTPAKAISANAKPAKQSTPAATPTSNKKTKVIGNSDSKRYHLPGMKYYAAVKASHRVEFDSEDDAVKAGYKKAPQ